MCIYLAIKVTAFGIHLQGNKKFYIEGSLVFWIYKSNPKK